MNTTRRRATTRTQPVLSVVLWSAAILCCGLPLLWLLMQLLTRPEVWSEAQWDSFQVGILGRTLLYNASAAFLAVVMCLPAALVVGRGRGVTSRVILLLLPLAVIMPSITYTYGWMQVFRLAGIFLEPAGPADVLRC